MNDKCFRIPGPDFPVLKKNHCDTMKLAKRPTKGLFLVFTVVLTKLYIAVHQTLPCSK